jgi:hypothetical protein
MSDITPTSVPPPRRLRRAKAVVYLAEVHGIEIEEKTLGNRNAAGLGPKPEYFGTIPFYRTEVLDAWAESTFTAESPVAVSRRKTAALAAQDKRHQPRDTRKVSARRAAKASAPESIT